MVFFLKKMAFFEILAFISKYLLQYSYKKSKYLVEGIQSYTFTPRVSVSFEEGILGT